MTETKEKQAGRAGQPAVNRKYKDNLFRLLFGEKEELLNLYNALNHTKYEDPKELEITTLENAIYMGMKNDLSFLIDGGMFLYEAQSTPNANMPARGLFYFAKLFQAYADKEELDLYKKGREQFPCPDYVVFYNGREEAPDEQLLRLSDAFAKSPGGRPPCVECVARVLNINAGHNQELMENCRTLYEYAEFIKLAREKTDQFPNDVSGAMDLAIEESIRRGILVEFLRKHQAEVKDMFLTEYNEELHMKTVRKEGWEEGRKSGWNDGRISGWNDGCRAGEEKAMQNLMNHMKVSEKEAREMLGLSEK